MSIVLIDTSIFCEILQIPGKCQTPNAIRGELERLIRSRDTLLLPVATILETGRHISQLPDGQVRRRKASEFIEFVQQALDGEAAWIVSQPLLDPVELRKYLSRFPDLAMQGVSFADLTIIEEYERQCRLHREREIRIWTLDSHMEGYHRESPGWVGG